RTGRPPRNWPRLCGSAARPGPRGPASGVPAGAGASLSPFPARSQHVPRPGRPFAQRQPRAWWFGGSMQQLADSSGLIGDRDALLGRLAADGYLLLRGLLPPGARRATGAAIAGHLREGGWNAGAGSPKPATVRDALADPA